MAVNIRELEAAERLVARIEQDSRHPVNDRKHPEHRQSVAAFNRLISKIDKARAVLAAERHFKF